MSAPSERLRRAGPLYLEWWVRPTGLATLLLATVFVGGTLGYVVVEGWSVWDSLFMTVISVTTVGYREIHPLSFAGQIFTSALLVVGVGTVFYTASLFLARVVESGLHHRWEARRLERMLDELRDHLIVCGYGRIGRIIVDELRAQQAPHVVVDRNPDRMHEVIESGGLAVAADASAEEVLKRVGVHRARGLIAVAGTDAENVYIILSARLMRPDLFIIGRAESDDARKKMLRAGADRVISPYQLGAHHITQTALRPAVVDFMELATGSQRLELAMEQIRIQAGSALADLSLVSANLRQRFGVIVVAIQRHDGHMEFNPAADSRMQPGDQMVVLGRPASLKDLEREAGMQVASS